MKRTKQILVAVLAVIVVSVLSAAMLTQPSPVTLTMDARNYYPGQFVTVTILVHQSLNTSMIWLYVDQPNGLSFLYTPLHPSSQNFSFTLPNNALEGEWKITVTWDHSMAQTSFTVTAVPISEFSAAPALVILAIVVVLFVGKRGAKKQ